MKNEDEDEINVIEKPFTRKRSYLTMSDGDVLIRRYSVIRSVSLA